MGKLSDKDRAAFARLDALYATLPTVVCKGLCGIACGALPLTELEARRLQLATHQKPRTIVYLTPTGRPAERCIYLSEAQRCRAYAVRPLICRVFGVAQALSCIHGCVPDRWLGSIEYLDLAQAVERLGGGRIVRTTPEGLVDAGEAFANFHGRPRRADAVIAADDERTRHLRALHGGHIVYAADTRKE